MVMRRQRIRSWMLVLGAAAIAVLMHAGAPFAQAQFFALFAGVALLAAAAELLLIRYPLRPEYSDRGIWLSVSTPIVIAVILVYGWQFGVWLDALITLLAGTVTVYLRSTRLRWVAVNTFQSILSAWAAGIATAMVFETPSSVWNLQSVNALGLGLLVYMLVNGVLVSMTVALAEGVRLRWVLAQTLLSLPRDIVPSADCVSGDGDAARLRRGGAAGRAGALFGVATGVRACRASAGTLPPDDSQSGVSGAASAPLYGRTPTARVAVGASLSG